MFKRLKIYFFFYAALLCGLPLSVQSEKPDKCDKISYLADPILYDYLGTITGYLKDPHVVGSDFRDAPGPLPKTGLKAVAGDLKSVSGSVLPSFRKSGIKKSAKIKFDVSTMNHSSGDFNKILSEEGVLFNPLFYKVKLAEENGRIDSFVIPLDLNASANVFRNYLFVNILLESDKYEDFVRDLEKKVFFKFAGERKIFDRFGKTKEIIVLGWIPRNGFNAIYDNPKVLKVSIEDSRTEFPAMTKISFMLKLPRQIASDIFVASFLKDISEKNGFRFESVNSLENGFGLVNVTGKAPIDKINDIFSSPFVLQIKHI